MLENQATYLEGREAELFSMLLSLRYCNKVNVRIDPFSWGSFV
jgi:CLIP-associating protein 1/2